MVKESKSDEKKVLIEEYLGMGNDHIHVFVTSDGERYLGKLGERYVREIGRDSIWVIPFEDRNILREFVLVRTPTEEEYRYLRKVGGKVQTISLDTIPISEVIPSIEEEKPIEAVEDKIVSIEMGLWNISYLADYKKAGYIDLLKCFDEHRGFHKLFENKEMEFNYVVEAMGLGEIPELGFIKLGKMLYDFGSPSEGFIRNRTWNSVTCYLLKNKKEITVTSEEIKEYSEKHKISRGRGAIKFLRDRMEENKKDIAIFYNDKGKLVAFSKAYSTPKVETYSFPI